MSKKNKKHELSVKQQFIEAVKQVEPTFDPTFDEVRIHFDGGGDSFNSFHSITLNDSTCDWSLNNDLLFKVMDDSGAYYHWVSANMSGEILFKDNRLMVRNHQCEDNYPPDTESYDEEGNPLDADGDIIYESDYESDCSENRGIVLDEGEESYDTDEYFGAVDNYDSSDSGVEEYYSVGETKFNELQQTVNELKEKMAKTESDLASISEKISEILEYVKK